jgi:phosphate:Na+ symporter
MDYTSIIFSFLGSLGLFLFGMTVLSRALQKTAGCKMKQLLGKMSKTRFRGVLFGTGVTAIIQSSTATTVMAVGFVNAGIISLTQIVGIIMGANIGSTTTSWLVSSVEWAAFLKPDVIGAVCAAGGALMLLFSKKGKVKNIGEVIVGFGVLFIGLSSMPAAVKPLAELDAVRGLFVTLGDNPILALLAGILVTGVIQSSTASIGILQSMAITGMIPWSAAVFIVLGQNVGTCFTTMLTSIGANKNTKAASYVHFVYNAAGAVIFSIGAFVFFTFINPAFGETAASSTNVSMIHTGYNVLLLLFLFPLGAVILRIAMKMAGEEKPSLAGKCELTELDESILETPGYALENSEKAVHKLTGLLRANIVLAAELFVDRKFDKIDSFNALTADTDRADATIRAFLTKLYNENLSEAENVSVASLLHTLTGLERISNHAKGVVKRAVELRDGKLEYSDEAVMMLRNISEKTVACYDEAVRALTLNDAKHAALAVQGAEEIQELRGDYKAGHLERVSGGSYNVQSGIVFMEAARHMSRIASHSKGIAEAVSDEPAEETA